MQFYCQNCRELIPTENINLQTQWAKCVHCDSVFTIQELSKVAEIQSQIVHVSSEPPLETTLRIEDFNGEYKIISPPASFVSQLPMMGFSTFWVAFITFWTFAASAGGGFFAAFSTPFWLVGIVLWGSILNNLLGSESIIIRQNEIEVRRDRLPIPYKKIYPFANIQRILFEAKEYKAFQFTDSKNKNQTTYKNGIVLKSGAKEEVLFQTLTDAEGEWLRDYLKMRLGIFK